MMKKSFLVLPLAACLFALQIAHAENRCLRMLDKYVDKETIDLSWCTLKAEEMPLVLDYIKQHPTIHSVDLSSSNPSADDLTKLTANKSITKITMMGANLDGELASILVKDKYLTELDISDNKAIGDGMTVALATNTTLASLTLRYINATDKTAFALRGNNTLNSVDISYNSLTDNGAFALTKMNLRVLGIGTNDLTEKGLIAVAQIPTLQSLDIAGASMTVDLAKAIAKNSQLQELQLYNTGFSDEAAAAFAHNSSLQVLNLIYNPITNKGLTALATISSLREINLNSTNISEGAAQSFINHPNLENISLGNANNTYADVVALSRIPKLQEIGISGYGLDDKSAALLATCRNLTSLYMGTGDMTDQGILTLVKMPKLKVIALGAKSFSNDVLQAIADKKKVDLVYLLSDLPLIGDKLKILAAGKGIKAVWLFNDRISDLGVMALAKSTSIKELDLSLNEDISDVGAAALASNKVLREIALDSRVMTQDGLDQLNNSDIPFVSAYIIPFLKNADIKASKFKQRYIDTYCNGMHQNPKLCRKYKKLVV